MGWYVHLEVSFKCGFNEGIAALAKQHLARFGEDDKHREARWYLQDLAGRTGMNPGPKGGLSLWGIVANGTGVAKRFVEALEPFWCDLLSGNIEDGPPDHQRVIVLYEEEGSEAANAFEIGWENPWPEHWGDTFPEIDDRILVIRHHGPLPFAWMQY